MKTKNNYKVASEYGTFTRSTNRTYNYVVITCGRSESSLQATQQRGLVLNQRALKYALRCASIAQETGYAAFTAGRWIPANHEGWSAATGQHGESLVSLNETVARHQKAIATAPDRLEAGLAANADAIANKNGKAEAWSSRLDLALREAAKLNKFGYYARIIDIATGRAVA